MKSIALTWTFLTKVSIGNPNASFTEGNVQTCKKVTAPDGREYAYISSQCQRHNMRERLQEMGYPLSTPVDADVETTVADPTEFIDDDIFGYLVATPNETRKRTSPLRVAPLISLFPFRGDRDLLTKTRRATARGGNVVETEIYSTIMRGGGMLELDRVGEFPAAEIAKESAAHIAPELKIERARAVLESLRLLWGGGKQTNLLADISPKYIVFTLQNAKIPFILETLKVEPKNNSIDTGLLRNALENYSDIVEKVVIGTTDHFITESEGVAFPENTTLLPIREAFASVQQSIEELYQR